MKTIKLPTEQFKLMQALVTKENFYAEPGFSDVATTDIPAMVSPFGIDTKTTQRALKSLINKGLLFTDHFSHNEITEKGKWGKVSYTIVYLSEALYHLVDWDKNYYQTSDIEDAVFIDSGSPMKATNPTGDRGSLTPMKQGEYDVNNMLGRESAIIEALKVTDMKNAKTALNKFIKSDRTTARYYGITLVKK